MDLHIVLVGHLQENKERIRNFRETGDSRYIYQNELDKAYFQHDMAYENLKDLSRGTTSGKILHDKAFTVAKNRIYDGCWRELVSMVCNFVDTKTSDAAVKNGNITNQELAEELHKPITRKLEDWNIIDISSKYACVSPLKGKKSITITKQNMDRDKDSEFYKRTAKSCPQYNNIEMHWIHNEEKSVVTERFIGTLKNKIYNTWLQNQRMCILIN